MAEASQNALSGKRIVITRAAVQSEALARELSARGAIPVVLPLVSFADPEDFAPLDAAITEIQRFDWIIFTSAQAVRAVVKRGEELKRSLIQSGSKLRIASVGPVTAEAARQARLRVDYVAETHTGAALAEELGNRLQGAKVFLPRSDRANQGLPPALKRHGARVTEVIAYRTLRPTDVDQRNLGRISEVAGGWTRHCQRLARSRCPAHRLGKRDDGGIGRRSVRRVFRGYRETGAGRSKERMSFPTHRPRRLRRSEALRGLVRETRLTRSGLIYPMFVCPGTKVRQEVSSMPGVYQQSVDQIVEECREVESLGIPGIILFGLPESKDPRGASSLGAQGVVQRAIEAIRKAKLKLLVITDVCLCEYTDHGHCGVIENGEVANDSTLAILAQQALSHVRAGADIVAPSDMMDGRVGAIRETLDEHKFENIPILSYAAKYCSGFYGPFREAAQSAPQFGDRRSYQMDPANAREALKEVKLDLEEGADMVMIKPALAYLDVIRRGRDAFDVPVGAYNVSGEYAMVKAAAQKGWLDEQRVVLEILTGVQRAGAEIILTYHAKDVARWLKA